MKNIIDYIKAYGDYTLTAMPFNEVDSLVLSQLAYVDLKKLNKKDHASFYIRDLLKDDNLLKDICSITWFPKNDIDLIKLMAQSIRYQGLEIMDFYQADDYSIYGQFTGFVTRIGQNQLLIVNRGTDASFTGWAESLALSFEAQVPAQLSALKYLDYVANKYCEDLVLAGHSKGGNLVVFAASIVDEKIQKRIKKVYNLDGPGFLPEFYQRDDYKSIEDRVLLLLPKQSIFGLLLYGLGKVEVVDSRGMLIEQHYPYNWRVEGQSFYRLEEVDKISKFTNNSINKWMQEIDREERRELLKLLVNLFDSTGADNVKAVLDSKFESYKKLNKALNNMPDNEIKLLKAGFGEFLQILKDEAYHTITGN